MSKTSAQWEQLALFGPAQPPVNNWSWNRPRIRTGKKARRDKPAPARQVRVTLDALLG